MHPAESLSLRIPFALRRSPTAYKIATVGKGWYLSPALFLGPKADLQGCSLHFCLVIKISTTSDKLPWLEFISSHKLLRPYHPPKTLLKHIISLNTEKIVFYNPF